MKKLEKLLELMRVFYTKKCLKSLKIVSIFLFLDGEINATKTNFKKEGLISKLPQFVKSLFKLSINWTIIYPAQKCLELARLTSDIFVFRPINFTFQNTKSMLKMSFSLINKYNPFAPNN